MEPVDPDNATDGIVQPPVHNNGNTDGKTAPVKKPDFSEIKFRCYAFRVMPPSSLKLYLKTKFKSVSVIAMNVTQCRGNFRPSLTVGFNKKHPDCEKDWQDAASFEFKYGDKTMTFKVPEERIDSDKHIRVIPSMTKMMYINQLPVALAMYPEKIPQFFEKYADFVENGITIEWPDDAFVGSAACLVKKFKLIPAQRMMVPGVDLDGQLIEGCKDEVKVTCTGWDHDTEREPRPQTMCTVKGCPNPTKHWANKCPNRPKRKCKKCNLVMVESGCSFKICKNFEDMKKGIFVRPERKSYASVAGESRSKEKNSRGPRPEKSSLRKRKEPEPEKSVSFEREDPIIDLDMEVDDSPKGPKKVPEFAGIQVAARVIGGQVWRSEDVRQEDPEMSLSTSGQGLGPAKLHTADQTMSFDPPVPTVKESDMDYIMVNQDELATEVNPSALMEYIKKKKQAQLQAKKHKVPKPLGKPLDDILEQPEESTSKDSQVTVIAKSPEKPVTEKKPVKKSKEDQLRDMPKFPDGSSFEELIAAKGETLDRFTKKDADSIRTSISRRFETLKKAGNFPSIFKIADDDPKWKNWLKANRSGGKSGNSNAGKPPKNKGKPYQLRQ